MRSLPPYPGSGGRPVCDWCGYAMRRIGAVETGMLRDHASVWLCWRQDCGHEAEIFDTTLPLDYWRAELGFLLVVRAVRLNYAERQSRWARLFEAFSGSGVGGP